MALSKVTNDLLALGENTSSLNLPKGTTAQRPSSPVAGMVRENTDDNVIEYYNGTEWKQVLTQDPPILVDYLVVAGGAGGSQGGGGAGGYLTSTNYSLTSGNSYTITIGAGGNGSNAVTQGINGSNSVFDIFTSIGGGGGGNNNNDSIPGSDGGSGGGGNGGRRTGSDSEIPGENGDPNTGGGAGGGGRIISGNGGSGVGGIRVPASAYSGSVSGSYYIINEGDYITVIFTGSGTYNDIL